MDARNTGALIAQRRKALGLTQKQLAERLLISDKAVSKWEVGASYPEVTLLPALAQILGLTVDELLAGAARGEEPPPKDSAAPEDAPRDKATAPDDTSSEDGDSPQGKTGAPSLEAFLTPQKYLADRQGSTDDRMLLAAVVCLLATMYASYLFGQATVLRNLVIVVIVYIAFRVWHNKQCDRFAALGMETAVSRRRAYITDRLFGVIWVFELLMWGLVNRFGWILSGYEVTKIDRYRIAFDMMYVNINSLHQWLPLYAMAYVPLALVLVAVFALAYRRMTAEIRFRLLPLVLPALPCLIGAGVIGWQRAQTALARMPQFGDPQPTISEGEEMGLAIEAAGYHAMLYAAAAAAALLLVLLVLWRVTHGRVPFVSAVMLAVDAVIWLPSTAIWLDIDYEIFAQQPYAVGDITIQLGGLIVLLILTALCAGIALFADSLRRQKT